MAWPLELKAQPADRVRRIGVLMTIGVDDPFAQTRVAEFLKGMAQSGWTVGRNLAVEIRWGSGDPERTRKEAAELVALAPEVILATGSASMGPLLQITRTVPIVFVIVLDPVGAGYVESLARPGGNATGFVQFEYGLSAKWLELLKQVAPGTTRVAVIRDAGISGGIGQFGAIQSAAPQFGVDITAVNVRDAREIERALTAFARAGNGGLIVTSSPNTAVHRELIIARAARLKLPAVYYARFLVEAGGLISYGPDFLDQYRRAVGYVDRILKGEKPADMPVQQPTKFELAINVRTAKALGLTVPDALLARADEVVE